MRRLGWALVVMLSWDCGRTEPFDADAGRPLDAGTKPDAGTQDAGTGPIDCPTIFADPTRGTDLEVWNCAVVVGTFGACNINDALACSSCACSAYVKVTKPCGACAGWHETGCSDSAFFAGPPMFCEGERVHQSACMIRHLLAAGVCAVL